MSSTAPFRKISNWSKASYPLGYILVAESSSPAQ
jgi:hypothetical protein